MVIDFLSMSYAQLLQPESIEPLSQTPSDFLELKESFQQKKWAEFYQTSESMLMACQNTPSDSLTMEELSMQLWLAYYVSMAPVFEQDEDENTPLMYHDHIDLQTKMLVFSLVQSLERHVVPVARMYHLRPKSLSALLASYSATLLATCRSHYDPKLEMKHAELRKAQDVLDEKRKEETLAKYGFFVGRDPRTRIYFNKLARNGARNRFLQSVLEGSSTSDFVQMLVNLFPGQTAEVKKYIRMAGYGDQEIPELINRTVGRTAATEFLYQGMSRHVQKPH